jgi:hypothetical protein
MSNNNSNGGNGLICTYLANGCNDIGPEDLLVGKIIIDNGNSRNDWMKLCLLHQNQLCNEPILTLLKSLVVFLLIACVGNDRTE